MPTSGGIMFRPKKAAQSLFILNLREPLMRGRTRLLSTLSLFCLLCAVPGALLLSARPSERILSPDSTEFQNPPKHYRPWTIWWWFGNASDAQDLAFELTEMDKAGIGGAEIFPVYPLSENDPAKPIQNAPLYSAEWKKLFTSALQEAEKRDMKLSLLGGSGWPLGGPWVPQSLSSKAVAHGVLGLHGPGEWVGNLPAPIADKIWSVDRLERLVMVGGQNGAAPPRRLVIPLPPKDDRLRLNIPAGEWRLYAVYRMFTNQQLERGGPGGQGLVLDHFDTRGLDLQLNQLESLLPTIQRFRPTTFVGFAADSLELEDSNWSDDFLDEFARRRGYDLTLYLPDLWDRVGPESNGVRQDFLETVSELMLSRYFQHYTAWARKHDLQSIVQSHGTIADVLTAYGKVDVPDVETMWPGSERLQVNLRSRRLGVSASHIYGKQKVSAESYTWLKMPRFLVSLALMKAASDALYIDGVNQIKNHGYSSSPRRVGKPGWVFYASTLINHNQTWWPHYRALAAYVTRMNYLMQSGQYVADVALYHNLPDARAHFDHPKPEWLEDYAWRHPKRDPGLDSAAGIAMKLRDCADRLQQAGYGFDVINDDALLNQMSLSQGMLSGQGMSYRALVFYNSASVPVPTLMRARDFARAGGAVVAVGRLPEEGVGLLRMAEQRQEVKSLNEEIWGKGKGVFLKSLDDLSAWLDQHIGPDFRMKTGENEIGFIHRRSGERDIYFVANGARHEVSAELAFRVVAKTAERWNPIDGRVTRVKNFRTEGPVTTIPITLGPWQSTAFVFASERSNSSQEISSPQISTTIYPVTGPWQVDFPEPLNQGFQWTNLRDWIASPETRDFSGIAAYRVGINLPANFDTSLPARIDLGEVKESAEVVVNGSSIGIAFMPPYQVQVTGRLKPGENQLEIRVANLWNNGVLAMPKKPSKVPAPGYGITDVLYGPTERKLISSGLLGPVQIVQATDSES